MTCQIQWVNTQGKLTPDTNPSIGRIRTMARYEVLRDGRTIHHEASKYFHVCAEHAKQLREHGMHIWEWEAK